MDADDNYDEDVPAQFLRFGDAITLYDNDNKGYLHATCSSKLHSSVVVKSGGTRGNPQLNDFKSAVFVVQAFSKFRANKELRKQRERLRKENPNTPQEQIEAQLYELKKLAEAEKEDNTLEQRRRHGDTVQYGQVVQLLHPNLDKYLQVSSRHTSRNEPSHMRMELEEHVTRSAWFKIMPRYKVRAEGDHVRMTDQIKLESVQTPGQYVHTSTGTIPEDKLDGGLHEANLSVLSTSYTIYPHRHPEESDESNLKGGDVIQLFHKEINAYLAAEGNEWERDFRESAHMRIREPDPNRPHRLLPPTSVVSFWQIELVKQPTEGTPVEWESQIRLKHVATHRYLCVSRSFINSDSEMEYSLTLSKEPGPDTVFVLHPVVFENAVIELNSYARIQHLRTDYWLHASRAEYMRTWAHTLDFIPSTPLSKRMDTLLWDGAQLREVTCTRLRMFDDAFALIPVKQEYVHAVNFVSGFIGVMLEFIRASEKEVPMGNLATAHVAQALAELGDFLSIHDIDGEDDLRRVRQKAIRGVGMVELTLKLVHAAVSGELSKGLTYSQAVHNLWRARSPNIRVIQQAFRLLEHFLDGNSRKNELYTAQYIGFFHQQIGMHLGVERMYTELVRDNAKIVDNIQEEQISDFINLLAREKNPDYLDFLRVLCSVEGVAIGVNQALVCQLLLEKNKNLVYLTDVDSRNHILVRRSSNDQPMELSDFCRKYRRKAEYQFLVKQLDLFGELCLQRCDHAIETITERLKYLTWEECFLCAKNENLPLELRKQYVELMANLFIDVDPNKDILEEVPLSLEWDKLTAAPYADAASEPTRSISGASFSHFEELSNWICNFIHQHERIVAQQSEENELLVAVLSVLHMLVQFGYYASHKDIEAIMKPLRSLLNGRIDMEHPGADNVIRTNTTSGRRTLRPRKKDKAFSSQHQDWLADGRFVKTAYNKVVHSVKFAAMRVIDTLLNFTLTLRLQHFLYDFKCAAEAEAGRRQSRPNKPGVLVPGELEKGPTLTLDQLMMLQKLANTNIELSDDEIYRYTEVAREYCRQLFDRSNYILPRWRPSDSRYRKGGQDDFVEVLLDLAKYDSARMVNKSLQLLDRVFSSTTDVFSFAERVMVLTEPPSISFAQRVAEKMPTLRRLGAGQVEKGEETKEFCDPLRFMTSKIMLDEFDPHSINQQIVINAGLLPILFDVIKQEDQPKEVLEETFNCLRVLLINNEFVQEEFYERLDDILAIETKDDELGWEEAMACAIIEVFRNNEDLSLKLRPDQVEKMMDLSKKCQEAAPSLLVTLRSIARCEELDVPLPRNQNLIMKYLMQSKPELLLHAYIDNSRDTQLDNQRLHMLRDMSDSNYNIKVFHANMVGLLASCAEGKTKFIESMCQAVFTIDDLLEVLRDSRIERWVRVEYLRFLLYVWLETADTKEELDLSALAQNEDLWSALSDMARYELSPLPRASRLTGEEERFVYEAFLPTITYIVRFFIDNNNMPPETEFDVVVTSILAFSDRALKVIRQREDLMALGDVIAALNEKFPKRVPVELLKSIAQRAELGPAGLAKSKLLMDFERTFAKQQRHNKAIHAFVARLKMAFEGRNSIESQLPGCRPIELDRDMPYCEDITEDEFLPLGPEFQEMLDLFVEYEKDGGRKSMKAIRKDDVRSLVKALDASHKYSATLDAREQDRQERLDIKCLQIMRGIIHNQNLLREDSFVIQVQNAIADAGAVLPVADTLNHTNNFVVREALAFLVSVLEGGNRKAQESFLRHFLSTREETFFHDVADRIRRSRENYRETRDLRKLMEEEASDSAFLRNTLALSKALKAPVAEQLTMAETSATPQTEDDGKFKDKDNIELVLRVLQYMCEGHNLRLQNYLREQSDNIINNDLVGATVEYFGVIVDDVTDESLELIIQTVETLVEFSQGCVGNQAKIFDDKAIDSVNYLLRHPHLKLENRFDYLNTVTVADPAETQKRRSSVAARPPPKPAVENLEEKIAHLNLALANLVLAMLEDSDEETRERAFELQDTLDIRMVFEAMHRFHNIDEEELDASWKADEDNFDAEPVKADEVANAFFQIILRLQDFTGVPYQTMPKWNPSLPKSILDIPEELRQNVKDPVYDDMRSRVVSIEIQRHDRLQKVYFVDKWEKDIRPEVREELKWNVERGSPSDKVNDFIERAAIIMDDIAHLRSVQESSPVARFVVNYSAMWSRLMLFMTFVINIFILSTWQAPQSWNKTVPEFSVDWYEDVLVAFGAIHLLMSCLILWAYMSLHRFTLEALLSSFVSDMDDFKKHHPWAASSIEGTQTSALSLNTIYHVCLVVFSVLGIFFHGYFYCFHLLHVVVGNDILLRVIRSVTKNGISLLWVAALLIIVIYIYSLISFAFLRKNFEEADGAFCDTAFQCFITSLRLGLMSGGGLGEALPAITFGPTEPSVRTIFDLSFFIIVTIVGLNVVFGIIVDTFSELRDERFSIQESMNNECFICSLPSYDFDRRGPGFTEHVRHEHNMWHYISFFLYLFEKDPTTFTSNEQYVYELFQQGDTSFFPINRAMSLRETVDTGVETRLTRLEEQLRTVVDILQQQEQQKTEDQRRQELREWQQRQQSAEEE